jgi:hypothetical protein
MSSFRSSSILALVLIVGACQPSTPETPAPADQPSASASTLPAARQILDRHIQEVGGREAMQRIQSVRTTATLAFSGLSGEMTAYAKRPNRLLVHTSLSGVGEIRTGYDGQVAWSIDPVQGPRLLTGRELEDMRERARFDQMTKDPSTYTSIETVQRTTFEGRPVFEVKIVRPSGREETEFYDAETGLQLGQISTQSSAMGQIQVTTVMSDYRRFGPLLMATKSVQRLGPQEITVTVTGVEYDTVADSVFALPPEIRALSGGR